eukprot:2041037-Prymnesium_polylepis.1
MAGARADRRREPRDEPASEPVRPAAPAAARRLGRRRPGAVEARLHARKAVGARPGVVQPRRARLSARQPPAQGSAGAPPPWALARLEAHACSHCNALTHYRSESALTALTAALPQEPRTAAVWRSLPADVAASLLVHDGQQDAHLWGLSLFFGGACEAPARVLLRRARDCSVLWHTRRTGARLLSLEELSAQVDARGSGAAVGSSSSAGGGQRGTMLALTDTSGFQYLASAPDGSVWLISGFNEHRKADSWAGFLERVLSTTI